MNVGVSNSAFFDDKFILSVVFREQCEYVGENAFAYCSNLKEINKDNEIKEIGSSAFAYCSNLSEITFNNLTSLHEGAFAYCSNLTNAKIPNCKIIPQNAFCECSLLSIIDMANIKEIGSFAFENCKKLKEINLNSCISIYDNAFMNCKSLTNVILSSCTSIYPNAFNGCDSLNKVLIYNDSNTFCELLSSTSFDKNTHALFYFKPDTISSYISADNWSHFYSRMRIFPADNQIKYETTDKEPARISGNEYYGGMVQNERFSNNDMIIIKYTENINSIKKDIFHEWDWEKITDIQLPVSCEKIEESAFEGFTSLFNITLPNTLKEISDYAFKNCKVLYTFNIPQSITSLGEGIFDGCDNIYQISGKFVTYNNEAIVCNNTLICVIPNIAGLGNEIQNSRIYNISDIDKNITRLGKSCFYGCKNMGRVNIPSNIESIGDNCFNNSDILEIHFEGDIPPEFGQNICGKYNNIARIFVPENSLSEYQNALTSSGGISADIIYPKPENDCIIYYSDNKISHLNNQEYINKNCTNGNYYRITNINNGILPTNYFNNQSEVTKVILSENIIEISKKSFERCSKLIYIYLPETLTTLGESCFCKCTKMMNVIIPSNVKKPENNIFEECFSLSYIYSYNKELISTADNRCFTHSGEIISFAPALFREESYFIPNNITSICDKAFYKCTDGNRTSLTKILTSESIKTIGENAFGDSTLLESVSLSKSLTSIGDKAFYNCTNLTEIIFENNSSSSDSLDLETIGVSAFENCRKMVIKSDKDFGNITTIKENAFKNCLMFKFKNLSNGETDLKLKNVSNINNHTFYNCQSLKKITLNDNITTIGNFAFYHCTSLENPNLPNTLTTIGDFAFSYCGNLKSLNLPNTLTTIGDFAFSYCENFKGYNYIDDFNENGNGNIRNVIVTQTNYILKIPKTVESIGTYCFRNTSIEKIEIDEDSALTKISDFAFYNCLNLKTIDIKSQNLTHIGRFAFYNCTKLCENISNSNRLVLNNIKVVDDNAFGRCENITYISFSSNLESLGDRCLQNINTSATVIISRVIPPIFTKNNISDYENSYPFGDKNTTGTTIPYIIVPNIYTYKNNKYWDIYEDDLQQHIIA